MATNDFLPFAGGVGANVIDQPTYAALTALLANGFSSGTAQSAQLNKVWRQSSILAAVLAQMIVDNTGQNATDDGTTATLLANLKKAVGGRLLNVQIFSSSGTYTPTPGTNSVVVEGVGGGGAGGGTSACTSAQGAAGGGGSSGAYFKTRLTSGFSGVTVTIGAGGIAASGAAGGAGGTTSFGAIASAPGGLGGGLGNGVSTFPAIQGFLAGAAKATGANIVNAGGNPAYGATVVAATLPVSGAGGTSFFGGGGPVVFNGNNAGLAGVSPGSGGSGSTTIASGSAQIGGAGFAGLIIVSEYA